jgi:hypothetical protein
MQHYSVRNGQYLQSIKYDAQFQQVRNIPKMVRLVAELLQLGKMFPRLVSPLRRILVTKMVRLLSSALFVCVLVLPSIARADSFSVFVGYADSLRASGFFPTPWLGASNVVSQSSPLQSFDTGAIRIDNTDTIPITITNFTITLNPNPAGTFATTDVFSIWGSLTINPGQTGIFTQTSQFNFDSSDLGIFGGSSASPSDLAPSLAGNNGIGGCSSTATILAAANATEVANCAANAPVISFMENGTLVVMTDTGQILNTGGYDFVSNSADGNESINWNEIGSGANRGGTGVPEPSTMFLLGSGLLSLCGITRRKLIR